MTRWVAVVLAFAVFGAGTVPAAERSRHHGGALRSVRPHRPAVQRPREPAAAAARQPAWLEPVAYNVVAADTDTSLVSYDSDRQWPPASMTKMMTVLLALEQVHAGKHTLAEPVTVSARAAAQGGSQVFLKAGEVFPLGDLLAAVMIPSANDAAFAVAEHLAGSVDVFVRRMNARARALELTH